MSETLLWLSYFLSGAAAFTLVHRLRWRIVPAMLVATLVTIAAWGILYLLAAEEERPEWLTIELSLNACFGLIFAGAGAALAHVLLMRRQADK